MTESRLPPDDLRAIFKIEDLGELKRHCRSATISRHHFANFIWGCKSGRVPFLHKASHRDFLPQQAQLTDDDLQAIALNGVGRLKPRAQKAVNKTFTMFDQRRLLSGHLFLHLRGWHFFYFDNRDREPRRNHWAAGPHIHLINHLFPNRTADSVWAEFTAGNPRIKGALHVRFVHDG